MATANHKQVDIRAGGWQRQQNKRGLYDQYKLIDSWYAFDIASRVYCFVHRQVCTHTCTPETRWRNSKKTRTRRAFNDNRLIPSISRRLERNLVDQRSRIKSFRILIASVPQHFRSLHKVTRRSDIANAQAQFEFEFHVCRGGERFSRQSSSLRSGERIPFMPALARKVANVAGPTLRANFAYEEKTRHSQTVYVGYFTTMAGWGW